jgi:hypothetical protein
MQTRLSIAVRTTPDNGCALTIHSRQSTRYSPDHDPGPRELCLLSIDIVLLPTLAVNFEKKPAKLLPSGPAEQARAEQQTCNHHGSDTGNVE